MRAVSIGGGPAGLYFAILFKKVHPDAEVVVLERNRPGDTFGFGVVFSDATLDNLERVDGESYRAITAAFAHWDGIDIHYRGNILRSTGHGFSGMSRKRLLDILERRARELGVEIRFETEVRSLEEVGPADLVLVADGVNSVIRGQLRQWFKPRIDLRPNRFAWLGTTFPFEAFTFFFKESAHGLFRVHAYRYEEGQSTFIVECTDRTWHESGMDRATEDETVAYCERLFADELRGHRLLRNRSIWRSFPTVTNEAWHHDNVVLMGDSAHTAHFSIGSGTKLAMEDAIVLVDMLKRHRHVPLALMAYEEERRPAVESLQRAAQTSLEWFENTERYTELAPLQFAFSLLTRSLRVTHENLALRDPELVARVDEWFCDGSGARPPLGPRPTPPPMFVPYRLRGLELANRVVVSPMCQYSANDGTIGDWHLVHLGSRAIGGAGLVIGEMTDVSADGRITTGCAGLYAPEHVTAWRRVTDFVHAHTEARIAVQLAHAGRKGSTHLPWDAVPDAPLGEHGWPLLAPSPIPFQSGSRMPKAMDRDDLERVRDEFVRATHMAVEADFDMIELHFAHGYLLSTFISPLTNRRSDEYGGSLDGRLRFPLEILDAVRAAWPDTKPISVRISATDWAPGGLPMTDAVRMACMLAEHGCDIVDVSAGQTVADAKPAYGRLFQTPFAERIRLEAKVPTMTVGAISSHGDINSILAAGRADLCVLARGHLYDPYFTRHAATALEWDLEWPPPYRAAKTFTPRDGR